MRRAVVLLLPALAAGCFAWRSSDGGGQTSFESPRTVRPADVALPPGYRIEVVARDLTFPTAVAFDGAGRLHVLEAGYSYGEVVTTPRLLRVEPDGRRTVVASGDNPPWNGVAFHDGAFYVAGGHMNGGRLLRIDPDGRMRVVLDALPSFGDHHTNGPAVGPDGFLYVGQGTATNSGVVGLDNRDFGWLPRQPGFHDVPCRDVRLAGVDAATENPLTPQRDDRAVTGAYVPFGTPTRPGQVVPGRVPCNGAVLRVRPEGGPPELVAWGFRNPFGLAFTPDGRLLVTENGYDVRGSRPVFGAPDVLWVVEPGRWYGWPDFAAGRPLTEPRFRPPREGGPDEARPELRFVLAEHPGVPPAPAARLGVHSSSTGLDVSRQAAFGHVGEAFVAQFGDMAPTVGKVMAPVGFKVVRVDPATGVVTDFAVNRGETNGPASRLGTGGLERPVGVRFDPAGVALYVADFGVMTMSEAGPRPRPGTSVVWRISRQSALPIAALLLVLSAAAGCGPSRRAVPLAPPLALVPEAARGERVFMRHCHECHPHGEAGLGFALNDKPLPAWLVRYQVRHGLGAMPAFGPDEISDEDLDALLAYLEAVRAGGPGA